MKFTKAKIKQIIREEIARVKEGRDIDIDPETLSGEDVLPAQDTEVPGEHWSSPEQKLINAIYGTEYTPTLTQIESAAEEKGMDPMEFLKSLGFDSSKASRQLRTAKKHEMKTGRTSTAPRMPTGEYWEED